MEKPPLKSSIINDVNSVTNIKQTYVYPILLWNRVPFWFNTTIVPNITDRVATVKCVKPNSE
jgi:hypothetical protein